MNNNFSQDAMKMYCEAYLEGFNKSQSKYYTRRTKDASKYANLMFPELAQSLYACAAQARGDIFDKELAHYGHSLKTMIGQLKLKRGYENKVTVKENNNLEETTGYSTYQSWVVDHDFIAEDELLVHFYQKTTHNAFTSARYRLRQLGYEFEKIENGWKVVKRPEIKKVKQQEEFSEAEIKLIKGLLKKFERM